MLVRKHQELGKCLAPLGMSVGHGPIPILAVERERVARLSLQLHDLYSSGGYGLC
jgi:hypothetical protein